MGTVQWEPSVEVRSAGGTREVNLNTHHLMNRCVFLTGEIDMEMSNRIFSQLMYLEGESKEPVKLFINSPGGDVNAGLFIYDTLQAMEAPVDVYCTGLAASMAAVIFAGGRKGHRFIFPHSKTMIHEPMIQGGVGGSATSILNVSSSILKTRGILEEILAIHTEKSMDEIREETSYDHFMDAEESVAFGICDAVTDRF